MVGTWICSAIATHGQVDPKTIDEGLYTAIRPDDIRKQQFESINGGLEAQYGYGEGKSYLAL